MTEPVRVVPADPAALPAEVAALVDLTRDPEGEPLRVIATLAHRPDLVGPFLDWSAALAGAAALGPRRHELAALRAAWWHRSDYEWGHHVEYARRAGVTGEEIHRLARPDLDGWTDADRVLLAVVDGMCRGGVDDHTWRTAIAHHDVPALVELAWTVGQYAALSMITDALGVRPEPGLDSIPRGPA